MKNVTTDGRVLHFLHKRRAIRFLTSDFELDQNIFSRGMAHHCVDVAGGDLQRLRLVLAAINDRWNNSLRDRKSTRLNSSHRCISYAVFCLKKKKNSNVP